MGWKWQEWTAPASKRNNENLLPIHVQDTMSDTVGVFTPQKLANVTDQGFCFRELGVKHLLAHLSTGNELSEEMLIYILIGIVVT